MPNEYAVLRWEEDGTDPRRSCEFSDRPPWDSLPASRREALQRLAEEGWQLVAVMAGKDERDFAPTYVLQRFRG